MMLLKKSLGNGILANCKACAQVLILRRAGGRKGFPAAGIACLCEACHTSAMYTAAVLDHFKNPRHAGERAGSSADVEVANPVCGDVLRLSARVHAGRVAEARFLARGCVTSIACGSLLSERLQGGALSDLAKITPEQISQALGGLPPATFHGAQLACDALAALLDKIASGNAISA
jgi:nitrogen fixation NifU-like protein